MMKSHPTDCSNVPPLAPDLPFADSSTFSLVEYRVKSWHGLNTASRVYNQKSDREGQQTKLSTT